MSKEFLRNSPLFAGLDEEDLDRLHDSARRVVLEPGEVVVSEGEAADAAYLVIDGTLEVTRHSGDREFVIDQRVAGDLVGEAALLEHARRTATVRAIAPAQVLEITRETFQELLEKCPGAALAVLQTVAGRLRHSEVMLRQREKMAALGTLAAGLAHELNNPAAAVQRAAAQLGDATAGLQRCAQELAAGGLSTAQMAVIEDLRAALPGRASGGDALGAIGRSDAESELQDWLEGLGMPDAWEMAPAIVAAGWTAADLAGLSSGFSPAQQGALARWLASAVVVYSLLNELSVGSGRIAEIVSAVKSYAYLDRGPVQLLDIHEGLENTLVILGHKLGGGIEVLRDYDRSLPRIEAYGGEINQVWTNLLDNAIDAMKGHGVLRIRTHAAQDTRGIDSVVVEIGDTGPGIPPAIQPRIFDAFFTTKEPGQGTGLGLHVVYTTVVDRHRGEIAVDSQPGTTTFRVTLPIQAARDLQPG